MKKGDTWLLIAILLIILAFGILFFRTPQGSQRGGDNITCYSDVDCPQLNYCLGICNNNGTCSNFSSCGFSFSCDNSGTPQSECVLVTQNCGSCLGNACTNGTCNLPVDINTSFIDITSVNSDLFNVTAQIRNTGSNPINRNFNVIILAGTNYQVKRTNFAQFLPGETLYVSSEFRLPRGTTMLFNASADFSNEIIETNENNNQFMRYYALPP